VAAARALLLPLGQNEVRPAVDFLVPDVEVDEPPRVVEAEDAGAGDLDIDTLHDLEVIHGHHASEVAVAVVGDIVQDRDGAARRPPLGLVDGDHLVVGMVLADLRLLAHHARAQDLGDQHAVVWRHAEDLLSAGVGGDRAEQRAVLVLGGAVVVEGHEGVGGARVRMPQLLVGKHHADQDRTDHERDDADDDSLPRRQRRKRTV